ncbi:hypothetical protein BC830DRAFT_1116536 [Chytriomyces sp. MP71]|nr:hypothetical protein BC830DRAFT_1116536 [Chytriomyces sp. MP71]
MQLQLVALVAAVAVSVSAEVRCGTSWFDAASSCGPICVYPDSGCPAGLRCYADVVCGSGSSGNGGILTTGAGAGGVPSVSVGNGGVPSVGPSQGTGPIATETGAGNGPITSGVDTGNGGIVSTSVTGAGSLGIPTFTLVPPGVSTADSGSISSVPGASGLPGSVSSTGGAFQTGVTDLPNSIATTTSRGGSIATISGQTSTSSAPSAVSTSGPQADKATTAAVSQILSGGPACMIPCVTRGSTTLDSSAAGAYCAQASGIDGKALGDCLHSSCNLTEAVASVNYLIKVSNSSADACKNFKAQQQQGSGAIGAVLAMGAAMLAASFAL